MDQLTATLGANASQRPHDAANLVEVDDLKVHFPIRSGIFKTTKGSVKAVDGVTFDVRRGETLGLVGESGCGKSTIGRAMIRLREPTEGSVRFDGVDLGSLNTGALRKMRRRMQIIFQDPYGSLDPRMTVGSIVSEPIETHHLAEAPPRRNGSRSCSAWSGWTPSTSGATPTSSRAASGNGSGRPRPRRRTRVHRL